jgi:hypothetical protein
MHVSSARRRTTDRRAAYGNGTAFSAVAPSKRPIFAAHRSNIREWYCPQARIAGHLTFQPLVQFQPAPRLSVGPIRIVQECGAFATYRPVSRASISTICRCITGPDAACSRGRELNSTGSITPVDGRRSVLVFRAMPSHALSSCLAGPALSQGTTMAHAGTLP